MKIGDSWKRFRAMIMERVVKQLLRAVKEPQQVFVIRYLDEDWGWMTVPVRAANQDEAREQVLGVVASIYPISSEATV